MTDTNVHDCAYYGAGKSLPAHLLIARLQAQAGEPNHVDWSSAPDDAQWHAIDSDGLGSWYSTQPYPIDSDGLGYWTFDSGIATLSARYNLAGVDWRTTLAQRPEVQL